MFEGFLRAYNNAGGNVRDAKLGRLPSGWSSSMYTDTHFGLTFDSRNGRKSRIDFDKVSRW